MTIVILIVTLTIVNFVWQLITERDWETAAERSWFQTAAVVITWLALNGH